MLLYCVKKITHNNNNDSVKKNILNIFHSEKYKQKETKKKKNVIKNSGNSIKLFKKKSQNKI